MTGKPPTGVLVIAQLALLAGCAATNMPTPPSQIIGSYTSGLKYENVHCSHLTTELDYLVQRENQLGIAQEERIKESKNHALWYGFGLGDGIEALQLANVRGEKEAVRRAIEAKGC